MSSAWPLCSENYLFWEFGKCKHETLSVIRVGGDKGQGYHEKMLRKHRGRKGPYFFKPSFLSDSTKLSNERLTTTNEATVLVLIVTILKLRSGCKHVVYNFNLHLTLILINVQM